MGRNQGFSQVFVTSGFFLLEHAPKNVTASTRPADLCTCLHTGIRIRTVTTTNLPVSLKLSQRSLKVTATTDPSDTRDSISGGEVSVCVEEGGRVQGFLCKPQSLLRNDSRLAIHMVLISLSDSSAMECLSTAPPETSSTGFWNPPQSSKQV